MQATRLRIAPNDLVKKLNPLGELLLAEYLLARIRAVRLGIEESPWHSVILDGEPLSTEVGITFFYVTHDQKVSLAISDTIAVMRDGRLEQVASPEEIYDRPGTRFVADFMGVSNIFPGKVIAKDSGEIQLETESGLRITALDNEEIRTEDVNGVCIHPERVNISLPGTDSETTNRFKGRIVEMVYQGDFDVNA